MPKLKELALGALIVLALIGMLFAAIEDALVPAERLVQPPRRGEGRAPRAGTRHPGTASTSSASVQSPPSRIVPYLEAEAEMTRAGCSVPATVGSES